MFLNSDRYPDAEWLWKSESVNVIDKNSSIGNPTLHLPLSEVLNEPADIAALELREAVAPLRYALREVVADAVCLQRSPSAW